MSNNDNLKQEYLSPSEIETVSSHNEHEPIY